MEMNVHNGFETKLNRDGTTKGIWAWPEIFTHDSTDGNKVAIVLLDTEGLFNIGKSLGYNTKIFALCTLFSSIEGYSVLKDVYGDTLELLDVFTSYTVYGSRKVNMSISDSTGFPFQNFNIITRDYPYTDESANVTLERIFGYYGNNDQANDTKARIKSVFKRIGSFQLSDPFKNVNESTFDGNTTQLDPTFKDKMEKIVTEILTPKNIVVKEIYGEQVKAKDLSRFFKVFTDVVENNITVPTTLVEVWALSHFFFKFSSFFN